RPRPAQLGRGARSGRRRRIRSRARARTGGTARPTRTRRHRRARAHARRHVRDRQRTRRTDCPDVLAPTLGAARTSRSSTVAGGSSELQLMSAISILMPVFNERETVEAAIDDALGAELPVESRELIVVDDGSTDGTRELLRRGSWPENVLVLEHDRN